MRKTQAAIVAFTLLLPSAVLAEAEAERVSVGRFQIDRTEVTIGEFRRFLTREDRVTAAERDGGGHEYLGGWVRRSGWTWETPNGTPGKDDEPAVHVSWNEAVAFCASRGGRLPSHAEWNEAAYSEGRQNPGDGFETGRIYRYPVGDQPSGMNTSADDPWPRHAPAGTTKPGVNGLFDMGGNAWEWLADRQGGDALTAGGSWWYGPDKTERSSAQWKPADFYAVYIGFRCAYDPER